jgi:hypothetical protein
MRRSERLQAAASQGPVVPIASGASAAVWFAFMALDSSDRLPADAFRELYRYVEPVIPLASLGEPG